MILSSVRSNRKGLLVLKMNLKGEIFIPNEMFLYQNRLFFAVYVYFSLNLNLE